MHFDFHGNFIYIMSNSLASVYIAVFVALFLSQVFIAFLVASITPSPIFAIIS